MTRSAFARAAAVAVALAAPSASFAFFPPTIGIPVTGQALPPDPFKPPTVTGQGNPEPPPPPPGPTVQTPEPASMVTALTGAVLAVSYGVRKRLRRAA